MKTLKDFEFHDNGINSLNIDVTKKEINIDFNIFNNERNEHENLHVRFNGVYDVSADFNAIMDLSLLEINDLSILEDTNVSRINLVLLQGPQEPSSSLEFSFTEYFIENGK